MANITREGYLDRELSWIHYNKRILEEGLRQDLPPLERFRFLSVVSSNFDEFFMVRVAALKRLFAAGGAGGEEAGKTLQAAAGMIRPMAAGLYRCLGEEIFPALARGGLERRTPPLSHDETSFLKPLFIREILPVLTPLRFGPAFPEGAAGAGTGEPPPAIANGGLYGAFLLTGAAALPAPAAGGAPGAFGGDCISIVEIPPSLDRVIWLDPVRPSRAAAGAEQASPGPASREGTQRWVLLEDLLMLWGDALFPGYEVKERTLFQVHRDADFSVDERRDGDFVEAMEEVLVHRDRSPAVRMVYSPGSDTITQALARRLELEPWELFPVPGPLDLGSLGSLREAPGFEELKAKGRRHYPHPAFVQDAPIWDIIRSGDALLSVPYQSFDPVVRFFQEAALDPEVISIKTTLYRTSGNSPVVRALEQAALNGKHVTAVVELKARFDEERNINWANRLERAGVIVIYGLARLKVHAKISQVIRREAAGLARYVHLSTGNYNDKTARLYGDLSLFTVRENFGGDATSFFNMLSGYSVLDSMSALVMAPRHLKRRLIELIDREARRASQGSPGRIAAKMNALEDPGVCAALYRASQAGVTISLNIRGICVLVPGLPGLSENIRVFSVVDHYLEHSRILYVNNGGAEEFFISSADWMPRNLERRVELLVPILDEGPREELRTILEAYVRDNVQAWDLRPSGEWERRSPGEGEKPFAAQEYLEELAEKAAARSRKTRRDLVVRRSPPAGIPGR
ncbi:MAG: polyphosphate kinase 1 [Treponema sp.]|jgi:polyphosphate kinase|nr:polyphosphate kinase 1 [Treponema sp.]